jgi:hypothetical protein
MSQDADNSKQANASEKRTDHDDDHTNDGDDKETSDNSDEDSSDAPSDKPVTVQDMIKQMKDTKPSSDVKAPEKMVRNLK